MRRTPSASRRRTCVPAPGSGGRSAHPRAFRHVFRGQSDFVHSLPSDEVVSGCACPRIHRTWAWRRRRGSPSGNSQLRRRRSPPKRRTRRASWSVSPTRSAGRGFPASCSSEPAPRCRFCTPRNEIRKSAWAKHSQPAPEPQARGGAHAGRWCLLARHTRGCARGLACPGLTNCVLSGLYALLPGRRRGQQRQPGVHLSLRAFAPSREFSCRFPTPSAQRPHPPFRLAATNGCDAHHDPRRDLACYRAPQSRTDERGGRLRQRRAAPSALPRRLAHSADEGADTGVVLLPGRGFHAA